jgi:hypothetical protein
VLLLGEERTKFGYAPMSEFAPQPDIERCTDFQGNVNPFTFVIRRSPYTCLTYAGAVLKDRRRLQCVNQTLKS